jgi:Zn-dependent protease
MDGFNLIFQLIILFFSAVVHEVAHGYAALSQGDATAKYEGRLTLNPIAHIDLVGSILVPIALLLGGAPVLFGWAKPVPFNPYNLRNKRWGEAIVALAGPAVNLLIALLAGLILRLPLGLPEPTVVILAMIAILNLLLVVFNMMPIPPLDGSKVLFALLPQRFSYIRRFLEVHSFVLVLVAIFVLWPFVSKVIPVLFYFISGLSV